MSDALVWTNRRNDGDTELQRRHQLLTATATDSVSHQGMMHWVRGIKINTFDSMYPRDSEEAFQDRCIKLYLAHRQMY